MVKYKYKIGQRVRLKGTKRRLTGISMYDWESLEERRTTLPLESRLYKGKIVQIKRQHSNMHSGIREQQPFYEIEGFYRYAWEEQDFIPLIDVEEYQKLINEQLKNS